MTAALIAKAPGVIAGIAVLRRLARFLGDRLKIRPRLEDGSACLPGDTVLTLVGPITQLLALERTGLNFMQRLSGTATLTRRFVEAAKPHPAKILDTRKTTPGLRRLEKWAVKLGGGENHRFGLFDMVLVKENHIALFRESHPGATLSEMVRQIRLKTPDKKIEVEVTSLTEMQELLETPPDVLMLDNFSLKEATNAMRFLATLPKKPFETEISGGVSLGSIQAQAATGVDRISIGALTHSAPALDLSLLVQKEPPL